MTYNFRVDHFFIWQSGSKIVHKSYISHLEERCIGFVNICIIAMLYEQKTNMEVLDLE
jgi:hypothetical protein